MTMTTVPTMTMEDRVLVELTLTEKNLQELAEGYIHRRLSPDAVEAVARIYDGYLDSASEYLGDAIDEAVAGH